MSEPKETATRAALPRSGLPAVAKGPAAPATATTSVADRATVASPDAATHGTRVWAPKLRVLVACEYSGRVRQAFRDLGHDAWSCDLLPAEDNSPYHYQEKLQHLPGLTWDIVIAHPPCTYLCNSGVRWLHERPERWEQMREAADFFISCLAQNADFVAVENPVMHKYAREIVGRGPDFTVQPWQFGDPAKKRTCFWTRGLPPLKPTSDMQASDARADCHLASPGPERWKERSRTYPGIAQAIAAQWSAHVLEAMQ